MGDDQEVCASFSHSFPCFEYCLAQSCSQSTQIMEAAFPVKVMISLSSHFFFFNDEFLLCSIVIPMGEFTLSLTTVEGISVEESPLKFVLFF